MLAPFQTPNLASPLNGSQSLAPVLAFGGATTVTVDITKEQQGQIGFIQSVFVDNSDNTAAIDLYFTGVPNASNAQKIRVQAYRQGWFPVSWPLGNGRIVAISQGGVNVPIILANYAMPYLEYGPENGALVVPPLTNVALDAVPIGAGGEITLIAAGVGLSNKLYRGMFEADQSTILRWRDGAGGTVLFAATLDPNGSVNFAGSGVNWFATTAGNALRLSSSAAINLYGGFGYVQS